MFEKCPGFYILFLKKVFFRKMMSKILDKTLGLDKILGIFIKYRRIVHFFVTITNRHLKLEV